MTTGHTAIVAGANHGTGAAAARHLPPAAARVNCTMAAGLARYGVTATMVHPPVTGTGWVTGAVRDLVAGRPVLFRVAAPDEVAGVIARLASDEAALVTGNVLTLR